MLACVSAATAQGTKFDISPRYIAAATKSTTDTMSVSFKNTTGTSGKYIEDIKTDSTGSVKVYALTETTYGHMVYISKNVSYNTSAKGLHSYIKGDKDGAGLVVVRGLKKGDKVNITIGGSKGKRTYVLTDNCELSGGADKSTIDMGSNSSADVKDSLTMSADGDLKLAPYQTGVKIIQITPANDPAARTIPDDKYASFSCNYPVTIPKGIKAYKATSATEKSVALTEITNKIIPANTGVVITGATSATFKPATIKAGVDSTAKAVDDFSNNLMVAASDSRYTTVPTTGTFYALNSAGSEFNTLNNGVDFTNYAYKAYVKKSDESSTESSGAKIYIPVSDENTTGINSINKTVENNGKIYNLQGIEVSNPVNGLYIKNGKKIIK